MSEPTKKCTNCEKDISESKFPLHEPFCLRNIIKCDQCGEPVTKDELEDHKSENHKLSDCKDCGKRLEKRLLFSHIKKCLHKPISCQYCSLEVPKNELHDHEYICGSKTETCHLCGDLIPIMEYDLHISYTCNRNEENVKNKENIINKDKFKEREVNARVIDNTARDNNYNLKKPASKKLNFEEYSRNLENLKKEFNKTNKTIKIAGDVINSYNTADNSGIAANSANNANLVNNNNNLRNLYSNNANIKNRKIDDFIDLSDDYDGNAKRKDNGNGGVKKSTAGNANNNLSKHADIRKVKNNAKSKGGRSKIASNSAVNLESNVDDYDNDIMQAILEMSKSEK